LITEANRLVATLYGMARNQLDEFVALNNMWVQYLGQVGQLIDALEQIKAWEPDNRLTLENIVHLCKDNIEGVSYRDPYDNNVPKAWHLSPEYEALLRGRLEDATAQLRRLDPSYAPPVIEKKEAESCFVVTATMGDDRHPTVVFMRLFRDEWLVKRNWGVALIHRYYEVGPRLASVIAPSPFLRRLSAMLIVAPAAEIAKLLLRGR
jgi:hypothetical protein